MTPRSRGVVTVILALLVALPLLPTALDDDGAPDAVTDDTDSTDDDASPDDSSDDDGRGDDDGGPDDTADDDTADDDTADDDSPDDDSPDDDSADDDVVDDDASDDDTTTTTDPSAPSSTPGTGTSSGGPGGTPSRPATLTVDPVGDLVGGRRGTLTVSITSANTAGGVVTLTVRLDDAGWAVVPDSCTRSAVTAVCTFALDAGERVPLLFELDVDAGADGVMVSADAVIAGGPDPAPVEITVPTVASAGGLAAVFSRTGFLDITAVGNTLASCADGASVGPVTCENVRAGTAPASRTNDAWAMASVRADGRASGSSSSADLDLGAETVSRAYLVWGASTTSTTPRDAASLRVATPITTGASTPDADADYVDVAADEQFEVDGAWQSIADVTSLVAAAGSGTYWGADIAADLGGTDAWAGWSLVVVHTSAAPADVIVLAGLVDLEAASARPRCSPRRRRSPPTWVSCCGTAMRARWVSSCGSRKPMATSSMSSTSVMRAIPPAMWATPRSAAAAQPSPPANRPTPTPSASTSTGSIRRPSRARTWCSPLRAPGATTCSSASSRSRSVGSRGQRAIRSAHAPTAARRAAASSSSGSFASSVMATIARPSTVAASECTGTRRSWWPSTTAQNSMSRSVSSSDICANRRNATWRSSSWVECRTIVEASRNLVVPSARGRSITSRWGAPTQSGLLDTTSSPRVEMPTTVIGAPAEVTSTSVDARKPIRRCRCWSDRRAWMSAANSHAAQPSRATYARSPPGGSISPRPCTTITAATAIKSPFIIGGAGPEPGSGVDELGRERPAPNHGRNDGDVGGHQPQIDGDPRYEPDGAGGAPSCGDSQCHASRPRGNEDRGRGHEREARTGGRGEQHGEQHEALCASQRRHRGRCVDPSHRGCDARRRPRHVVAPPQVEALVEVSAPAVELAAVGPGRQSPADDHRDVGHPPAAHVQAHAGRQRRVEAAGDEPTDLLERLAAHDREAVPPREGMGVVEQRGRQHVAECLFAVAGQIHPVFGVGRLDPADHHPRLGVVELGCRHRHQIGEGDDVGGNERDPLRVRRPHRGGEQLADVAVAVGTGDAGDAEPVGDLGDLDPVRAVDHHDGVRALDRASRHECSSHLARGFVVDDHEQVGGRCIRALGFPDGIAGRARESELDPEPGDPERLGRQQGDEEYGVGSRPRERNAPHEVDEPRDEGAEPENGH